MMCVNRQAAFARLVILGGLATGCLFPAYGTQRTSRWSILPDEGGIIWRIVEDKTPAHSDCIEMSGLRVSLESGFTVAADRTLSLSRKLFWPSFRKQPNDTYGTLSASFGSDETPSLNIDGKHAVEKVDSVTFDGILKTTSRVSEAVEVTRLIFPSVELPASYELLAVTNIWDRVVRLSAGEDFVRLFLGCDGRYEISARMRPMGEVVLNPGESAVWSVVFSARRVDRSDPDIDVSAELAARRARIAAITGTCILETGHPVLDTMFRFAKLHAAENIFATRGGLMHSPGGGHYYAGTWCNDQLEYAGPWFAFTGDRIALEASLNAYCQYLPFMASDYTPIPSSVIAEGFDYWNGAGDRGDAAMWAYGAARFVLTSGRKDWAARLLPGIRWTLEYCRRRLNARGVVMSNTDELEGRLPSGEANLCTSSLYYDALQHAAILMRELGYTDEAKLYKQQADDLHLAMEQYFGATIHGFQTYRYYEGCEILRSWIGIPLSMGIFDRAEGTARALFSPYLWTGDGMLSAEGDSKGVTWDRSALYAFRGLFASGETRMTLPRLASYSESRLLGEHVPYPVEAWPEGGRRQLSAESALYCRIFTEGLFGIKPAGFDMFDVKPHLPSGWSKMELRNINAFGKTFTVVVTNDGTELKEAE